MVAVVGAQAPEFKKSAVVDGVFDEVSLESYKKAGKWTVLSFVPMAFTFVCPTEIIAYNDMDAEFSKRNAQLLYASVDSQYTLLAWNNLTTKDGGLGGVKIPLVSDLNHQLSRDYGVLVEEEGFALRGTFIIDPEGVIQHASINNASVGRNPKETLRLLEAFQFTAEHGEVCPANWQPGSDTIDTKDSKKYFSKH